MAERRSVERRVQAKAGAGEAERPPLTPEQFENTPEFRRFREGMKQLLKVSKAELDRRVKDNKRA